MHHPIRFLLVILVFLPVFVCCTRLPAATTVLIRDVPHVHQKPDFCGEACVASWLNKLGVAADQDAVFDSSGLDPMQARGCYTKELVAAVRKLGFDAGPVWNRIRAADHAAQLEQQWQAMHSDLQRSIPSIVCMRTKEGRGATEHFRLILGYDSMSDEVIYHEPSIASGAYQRMPRQQFISLWPLKYKSEEWLAIRIRLSSKRLPSIVAEPHPTGADYAQHIMNLQASLPREQFTIVLQHPFVVIGDESPDVVHQRSAGTVKWATDRLKKQYFSKDPDRILNVWLFKDKTSYENNAVRLFGRKPTTPYGYYSSTDNALVMNISTGGGTLVHEIVHPFIEANFPDCPAWLNEGLGSLYEQSRSRGGDIVGLTNWRLAGLQKAIRANRVPAFSTLCSTTTREFYDEDPGTNYAQARYLCYYLQEKNLLNEFYHRFVENQQEDPTGYWTLQSVLKTTDMAGFKKQWESYVLGLRFN